MTRGHISIRKISVILFFTFILLCLLTEIWGRLSPVLSPSKKIYQPTWESLNTTSDPYTEIAYQKNSVSYSNATGEKITYQINSRGFRDEEHPYFKNPNRFRILLLGASRAFGLGINQGDRFSEIIEKLDPSVEIINMGICNFSIKQAEILFLREGIKYHPDLVLHEVSHGPEDTRVLWNRHLYLNQLRRILRARSITFKNLEQLYPKLSLLRGTEAADVAHFATIVQEKGIPYVLLTTRTDIWKNPKILRAHIPVIQLDPKIWNKGPYAFEGLGHVNQEGNKVLSQLILQYLYARDLIPDKIKRKR